MKKAVIITIITIVSLALIFVFIYGSLQFYSHDDDDAKVAKMNEVSFDDFGFEITNLVIHDWDKYEFNIPNKFIEDAVSQLKNIDLDLPNISYDMVLIKIEYEGDSANAFLTVSKGFLRFPIEVKLDILIEDKIILIEIKEVKCGWIPIKPKWIKGIDDDNRISIDMYSYLPDNLPIMLDEITQEDEYLSIKLSLNKEKMKMLIDDYAKTPSDNDLLDMSLPSIENMSMEINLGMFNETFDEYLKETLPSQELPLGIEIVDSHLELENMQIILDVQWLFVKLTVDAQLAVTVEDNILYYKIESLSLGGLEIGTKVLAFFEDLLGGYSIDLNQGD